MVDRRRAILGSLLLALLLFAGLLAVVGGREVLEVLAHVDPVLATTTVALGLCWLVAWGLMLWTILGTLGISIPIRTAFFVYAGAVFANNVTPFGQAGGEPVAAALVSRVADARYEVGFASIASVDVVNVAASVIVILVGVGYRATTVTLGDRLVTATLSAIVVVAVVGGLLSMAWRRRRRIVERLPRLAGAVTARLGPLPDDRERVERVLTDRLGHFFGNLERVAGDRRRLVVVLALSLLGWCLQAAALFTAFAAVGHAPPVVVLAFVIPLANLAGAAPLPGGLGGIEAAFVALLVPTTGVPAAAVTAAVLIHRVAIYWVPLAIGGLTTAVLGVGVATE